MSDRNTWRVTVSSPTGLTDEGTLTIIGGKGPDQRKLAGSLSDMVWRIAMDLYGQEEDEGDDGEHTNDPNGE